MSPNICHGVGERRWYGNRGENSWLDNDLIIGQPTLRSIGGRNHHHPEPHHHHGLGERRLLVGFNDLIITGSPINFHTRPHYNLDQKHRHRHDHPVCKGERYVKEGCCRGNGGNNDPPHTISLGNTLLAHPPCMHNNDTWLKLTQFVIFSSFFLVKVSRDICIFKQRSICVIKRAMMVNLKKSELTS